MTVESPKTVPLFSVRTTAPFPPPNWFKGSQPGFILLNLRWLTFMADTSPDGKAKA